MTHSGEIEEISNHENGKGTVPKEVDYDQLITAAGKFGVYHMYLIFLIFPFYIFGAFSYFGQIFLTEVSPNNWCWVPELENLTDIDRRKLAIPLDQNARFGYSQCQMYVANWTEVLSSGIRPNQSSNKQPCQYGWEFNNTEIPYPTITSEMGWMCDKSSYQANAQAIFFVGSVIGGFIIGYVSDRYGRIPGVVVSNMFGCLAGIISIFAQNFLQFSLCRLLMGISYDSCMMMMYILLLEFVAPKYRTVMANLPFAIFFTIGAVALPWIALACGHWKTISLVTSIPMALALLAPLVAPESPRWLLSKGRVDEAVNKVTKASRINKTEVPIVLIEQFKKAANEKQVINTRTLLDVVKTPIIRKIFICLCVEYMICMLVFDALVRSLGSLKFNFFASFALVSATELPSLVLISFILDITGRKWLSISCLLACCVLTVATAFISSGLPSVLCAVAARFFINMCANTSMQWGAEILPTSVRGSGVGFIHICGYVATILSPYVAYLQNYVLWLPPILIGVFALIGAATAFILPETAGKSMPQTFEQAEALIKNQKLFDIPCLTKTKVDVKGQINSSFEMN